MTVFMILRSNAAHAELVLVLQVAAVAPLQHQHGQGALERGGQRLSGGDGAGDVAELWL